MLLAHKRANKRSEFCVYPISHAAASGPKLLWIVPRAFHTAALGFEPAQFKRRVLGFFANPTGIQ
jgi:hypothetical protein